MKPLTPSIFTACPSLGPAATPLARLQLAGALLIALLLPHAAFAQTQTAEYEIVFDSTWSAATHPVQFPSGAHFSPLVGGTHNSAVLFWEPGGQSSSAIELMAEAGATRFLVDEVDTEIIAGFADQSLVGVDISSPGSTTLTFTANKDFPELTLVSMIAPSPDWFIGVHGLPLFDQGWWAPEIVVDLFVYDAGTDHGPTYTSPNQNANPALPIALQGAPLEAGVPVGTFTITRLPEPAFALQLLATVPWLTWLGRRRLFLGHRRLAR